MDRLEEVARPRPGGSASVGGALSSPLGAALGTLCAPLCLFGSLLGLVLGPFGSLFRLLLGPLGATLGAAAVRSAGHAEHASPGGRAVAAAAAAARLPEHGLPDAVRRRDPQHHVLRVQAARLAGDAQVEVVAGHALVAVAADGLLAAVAVDARVDGTVCGRLGAARPARHHVQTERLLTSHLQQAYQGHQQLFIRAHSDAVTICVFPADVK